MANQPSSINNHFESSPSPPLPRRGGLFGGSAQLGEAVATVVRRPEKTRGSGVGEWHGPRGPGSWLIDVDIVSIHEFFLW